MIFHIPSTSFLIIHFLPCFKDDFESKWSNYLVESQEHQHTELMTPLLFLGIRRYKQSLNNTKKLIRGDWSYICTDTTFKHVSKVSWTTNFIRLVWDSVTRLKEHWSLCQFQSLFETYLIVIILGQCNWVPFQDILLNCILSSSF